MRTPGRHTIHEILSQPAAWQAALDAVSAQAGRLRDLLARFNGRPLLLLGSGSPYYLAIAAAALLREYTGRECMAAPSAEIILNPRTVLPREGPALAIIFSRSGETSEAIAAARAIQRGGGAVVAIGCDAGTPLLRLAEVTVEVAAGREVSAAQTRSFAGMYVAVQALAALLHDDPRDDGEALGHALERLPELGPAYIDRARATTGELAADAAIERIFVLGSGTRYGLACETALKFQEMSLTNIHAYHALEFRHGPMSMADERALVIGLIGERGAAEELAVLGEAKALGARAVAIAERAYPEMARLDGALAFDSGLPELARGVLYLPPLQLMAYARAIAKGLDPDTPRNVTRFVRVAALETMEG